MQIPELVLFWLIAACYLATFVAAMFHAFFHKERLASLATWALWIGFLLHLGLFILQWVLYQHLPLHKPAIITVMIFLILQTILKDRLTHIAIFISLIALIAFFLSNAGDPSRPLSTAYGSRWLFLHMVSAWFAFGSFGVATAFAGAYLVKDRKPGFIPAYSPESMDRIMYKLVAVGVLFLMIMTIAGAIWAKKLFGRYWGWDAVEIWALIVLLFYMLYIHARLLLHVKGKLAAWMLIVGLILMGISMWGLSFIVPHIQNPMGS